MIVDNVHISCGNLSAIIYNPLHEKLTNTASISSQVIIKSHYRRSILIIVINVSQPQEESFAVSSTRIRLGPLAGVGPGRILSSTTYWSGAIPKNRRKPSNEYSHYVVQWEWRHRESYVLAITATFSELSLTSGIDRHWLQERQKVAITSLRRAVRVYKIKIIYQNPILSLDVPIATYMYYM